MCTLWHLTCVSSWLHSAQAEAKVLVSNGPVLANGSFIAVHETSGSAKDAESVANSPNDTPLVTPTKHIQYKVGRVPLSFDGLATCNPIMITPVCVLEKASLTANTFVHACTSTNLKFVHNL